VCSWRDGGSVRHCPDDKSMEASGITDRDNQVEDVDTIQLDYHDQRVCAYVSRFIIPRGENPAREDLALPHLWPPYPRWVAAPATTTRRPRQDFGCEHPFPCGFAPGGGSVHR